DGKLWSAGRDGNDRRLAVDKPAGDGVPGRVSDLNLSPDATRLLYTITGGGPELRIFMLDLGNGAITRQKNNGAWAPDGRHVVTSAGDQLTVDDVQNGT